MQPSSTAGAPNRIRVVVVDDSALVRSILKTVIDSQPDMVCVGAAVDPYMAREMIRELNPDVITLDVEMPRMDGLDFLEKIMRLRPMPVLMVSTLTERGAETTLRALELGAVDFVAKPRLGLAQGLDRYIREFNVGQKLLQEKFLEEMAQNKRTQAFARAMQAALVQNVGQLCDQITLNCD
jgi:two-component system chemotaxis response regulator CheB